MDTLPSHTPDSTEIAIEQVVASLPHGAKLRDLVQALAPALPERSIRYKLRQLVGTGRLIQNGKGKAVRYLAPPAPAPTLSSRSLETAPPNVAISEGGEQIRQYVSQPLASRKPVGYNRQFLDTYRPNVSFYLSESQRQHLAIIGKPDFPERAAGTYARHILNRLLIDLAWNSSRLEGNTYSLLDTKRLIELGHAPTGSGPLEAQMILNHKEAIEFLVNDAAEVGFNRYTLLNLHGILAQNLLPDPAAPGRLRHIAIGIQGSTFHPLELPQRIEECFEQVLATAAAIHNPFEQALFAMVQLPYLQPFDDVNKPVSRLAANIPFIRQNLAPLSFTDVPRDLYTQAVLGVYELNQTDLLRDVFIWAYERSAAQYAAVRQSLGEPDPFRFKHAAALKQVVAEVIRKRMDKPTAVAHIAAWIVINIAEADRERFRNLAETELLSLHEGNFARYRVRPSEFAAWQQAWA